MAKIIYISIICILIKCILIIYIIGFMSCNSLKDLVKRSTANKAPEGSCNYLTWGGMSGVHIYVCCNNQNESAPICDGKIYHTASSGNYCGSGGADLGNGKLSKTFKCGGCTGQDEMYNKCTRGRWNSWLMSLPGFCWTFTCCLKEQCSAYYN